MVVRTTTHYSGRPAPPWNPLAGRLLRYMIGVKHVSHAESNVITVVPYGAAPADAGVSVGYCNHLVTDMTTRSNAMRPDPKGPGFLYNLMAQFDLRQAQGFKYIEIDNPNAYPIENVLGAIELANTYGLKVVAKNPLLMGSGRRSIESGTDPNAVSYLSHQNVVGAIVEYDCGSPAAMNIARLHANKPHMPVWFVSWGDDRTWIKRTAMACRYFSEMRCTHSPGVDGYSSSIDVGVA